LSIAERLSRSEYFAHFAPDRLAALAEGVEEVEVPPESYVVRQGDTTQDAYWIERGSIRIQRATSYGHFALAILSRGDLFGEAAFVDGSPRSGDAYSTGAVELLCFRAARLMPRLEEDPLLATALYWAFWRSLSGKLRRTNEKLGRFFAQGTGARGDEADAARSPTGEFRIDLRTKRELFTEQKLSPLEINLLASLSKERRLRPGENLFREGDPGDAMYVVLDGKVRISKQIPGIGEEALGILERGDYFGEMALIDRQPRSADAKAHDAGAVVLSIPKELVDNLLDIRKVSAVRLLKLLCALVSKRLREVDDKLVTWYILAGGDVPEIR
jgi:CRP-like cAMP-binding protein